MEDSIDDWLNEVNKGNYDDFLYNANEEEVDAMNVFMSARTWDLLLWSFTSMLHSFFLLAMGYIGAFMIFFKMLNWNKDLSSDYLPLRYGWEAFIFGAMFGTMNFLAS